MMTKPTAEERAKTLCTWAKPFGVCHELEARIAHHILAAEQAAREEERHYIHQRATAMMNVMHGGSAYRDRCEHQRLFHDGLSGLCPLDAEHDGNHAYILLDRDIDLARNAALEEAAKVVKQKASCIWIISQYQDGQADDAGTWLAAAIRALKNKE